MSESVQTKVCPKASEIRFKKPTNASVGNQCISCECNMPTSYSSKMENSNDDWNTGVDTDTGDHSNIRDDSKIRDDWNIRDDSKIRDVWNIRDDSSTPATWNTPDDWYAPDDWYTLDDWHAPDNWNNRDDLNVCDDAETSDDSDSTDDSETTDDSENSDDADTSHDSNSSDETDASSIEPTSEERMMRDAAKRRHAGLSKEIQISIAFNADEGHCRQLRKQLVSCYNEAIDQHRKYVDAVTCPLQETFDQCAQWLQCLHVDHFLIVTQLDKYLASLKEDLDSTTTLHLISYAVYLLNLAINKTLSK